MPYPSPNPTTRRPSFSCSFSFFAPFPADLAALSCSTSYNFTTSSPYTSCGSPLLGGTRPSSLFGGPASLALPLLLSLLPLPLSCRPSSLVLFKTDFFSTPYLNPIGYISALTLHLQHPQSRLDHINSCSNPHPNQWRGP